MLGVVLSKILVWFDTGWLFLCFLQEMLLGFLSHFSHFSRPWLITFQSCSNVPMPEGRQRGNVPDTDRSQTGRAGKPHLPCKEAM